MAEKRGSLEGVRGRERMKGAPANNDQKGFLARAALGRPLFSLLKARRHRGGGERRTSMASAAVTVMTPTDTRDLEAFYELVRCDNPVRSFIFPLMYSLFAAGRGEAGEGWEARSSRWSGGGAARLRGNLSFHFISLLIFETARQPFLPLNPSPHRLSLMLA